MTKKNATPKPPGITKPDPPPAPPKVGGKPWTYPQDPPPRTTGHKPTPTPPTPTKRDVPTGLVTPNPRPEPPPRPGATDLVLQNDQLREDNELLKEDYEFLKSENGRLRHAIVEKVSQTEEVSEIGRLIIALGEMVSKPDDYEDILDGAFERLDEMKEAIKDGVGDEK